MNPLLSLLHAMTGSGFGGFGGGRGGGLTGMDGPGPNWRGGDLPNVGLQLPPGGPWAAGGGTIPASPGMGGGLGGPTRATSFAPRGGGGQAPQPGQPGQPPAGGPPSPGPYMMSQGGGGGMGPSSDPTQGLLAMLRSFGGGTSLGMGGGGGMGQQQMPQSQMFGQQPGMKNRLGQQAYSGAGGRVGGGFNRQRSY